MGLSPHALSHRVSTRHSRIVVAIVFFLIAGACGGDGGSSSADPVAADVELECDAEGYPCSLSEVPVEILERSDALGDEVLARFAAGATTDEVDTWLNDQEDMAEVDSDDDATRFRLEGGRATWILRASETASRGALGAAASPQLPIGPPAPLLHVVGPDSENKKARVLSPFLWDFEESDDGAAVAGILSGTRGYEGGVEFLSNKSKTASEVNVGSFKGWGTLEVVHVVSHGTRICKDGSCRAVVAAGLLLGAKPEGPEFASWLEAKAKALKDKGVDLGKAEGSRGLELEDDILLLTADFFRGQYRTGLKDTLVFFNACKIFGGKATDLADAIRGTSTVFLGWDENVESGSASAAAIALYKDLSEFGSTVDLAYSRLGALRIDPLLTVHAGLVLGERSDGDGLRIRDIVHLLDPESGNVMSPSDEFSIVGAVDDDEDDSAPYVVQVDGIPAEVAADAELHVTIDGIESDPQTVADGTPGEKADQWIIEGVIDLGYDLKEDTAVDLRAWVELPEDGESEHETSATLTGPGPIMGYTWELQAEWSRTPTQPDGPSVAETATARLTLEFVDGQAFDEPNPRYQVTGGTVTWNPSFTDRICRVTADTVTFDIGPITAPWVELVFDTTSNPVRWEAFIETVGPDVPAFYECYAGTGPDADPNYKDPIERNRRAEHIWLSVDGEENKTVSGDTISGTWILRGNSQPSYDRESHYTITRIK